MKIRRSLAAAALLATAAAPVALGAAPAFADTAPAGQEQTDPGETRVDDENRAAIEKLLVYPNDYLVTAPSNYLREHAAIALAGTPADRARFLAVEVEKIRLDDGRIAVLRLMDGSGPVFQKAVTAVLDAGTLDAVREFLKVGQFTARAEDENRAEAQRILDDPISGRGVREGAEKALAGSAADVERFLKTELARFREDDDRVLLSQIMSRGGPAVRKAAGAAMSGTIADVREFLKVGQFTARAEDEAAAKAAAEAARGTSGAAQGGTTVVPAQVAAQVAAGSTTTVVPASVTAGTPTTVTSTTAGRAAAGGTLAATGESAPLGELGGAAAAAVVLGAGAVVASRRRSQA
ncbi:ALF repeat-containing protein [Kitasatospora sp. NPDC059327]|uniref:ALF repeat-containing protein n=1 Tax=Kitasatospora sp. NPDC059327 TaxID=3346803 RepID=UPI0036C4EC64